MQIAAQPGERVLILAHGAGSSAAFLARAFPAAACGMATAYLDDRTGQVGDVTDRLLASARDAARRGLRPVLGGVSIGAHAAALACLQAPPGLVEAAVLVMPAWQGRPAADSPTALAAAEVADIGADRVLRRLEQDPSLRGDWVVAQLRPAWLGRATLAGELAAAATGAAPDPADLAALRLPALVVALADDPVHPMDVARRWAAALPDADFAVIARDAPAADLAVFGRRVGAWTAARLSGPRRSDP